MFAKKKKKTTVSTDAPVHQNVGLGRSVKHTPTAQKCEVKAARVRLILGGNDKREKMCPKLLEKPACPQVKKK